MIQYYAMKNFCRILSKSISTVFFIGYVPFAPGTFGSLAAMLFVWTFKPDIAWQAIILIFCFIIGVKSAHITEQELGGKDNQCIVIDEFVGYLVSIFLLPLNFGYIISAFFLFRFFDILKPPPIRNMEKWLCGGMGIMIDDVAAGIFSNIILQVWRLI